jgi:hypothetical protein
MFAVTAYRFGDKELHSYFVGMFNTIDRAKKAAADETEWRGGKYYCEILSMRVNETHREFRNVAQGLPK